MIRRHGHNYWLDFRIGKRRYRRSLGTDEHGLAIERAREIRAQITAAQSRKDIRFSDFKARYLEWAWTTKPASADREEQRILKIESFWTQIGIHYLADITAWHVEQLKAHLKEKGRSHSTINRYLQLLRGMFYRAADWDLHAGPNPLRRVKFYRETPARRLLTAAEVGKILDTARAISLNPASPLQRAFHDMVVLALNTGLRKSEILFLKWTDVCEDGLHVTGKGGKARVVPLNRVARAVIARQPRRSEYVFHVPNRSKGGLMRRTTDYISEKAGVPFHFHLLRHAFASRLLERGVDIITISELLGHSKAMTSLIYSHTDEGRKQKAVDILADRGRDTKKAK